MNRLTSEKRRSAQEGAEAKGDRRNRSFALPPGDVESSFAGGSAGVSLAVKRARSIRLKNRQGADAPWLEGKMCG
jgi:hypothetical protein